VDGRIGVTAVNMPRFLPQSYAQPMVHVLVAKRYAVNYLNLGGSLQYVFILSRPDCERA
jgi:hypothetical protein